MLRADGREFLLAQRPEGKVYAGYWEFPGGKVEPGESVRQALIRELQEELGITVPACSPWLTRQFTYPHATVRLNFWRVTAWSGEIGITAPLEHAAVDWLECGKNSTVAPILPANDPILPRAFVESPVAMVRWSSSTIAKALRAPLTPTAFIFQRHNWLHARHAPTSTGLAPPAITLLRLSVRVSLDWITPCLVRCCRRPRTRKLPAWAGTSLPAKLPAIRSRFLH